MAELLLVRHAQASFGSDDYDRLSELGWKQARWLGEYFAARGIAFDLVVRGTLRRHAETLAGIGEGLGAALASEAQSGLDEYNSLSLLRAHVADAGSGPPGRGGDQRAHFRLLREALYAWADGSLEHEPFTAFRAGVQAALAAIRHHRSARRVLVVSSGGPISTIIGEVMGLAPRKIVDLNLQMRNASISELRFNARAIHCVSFNSIPHLDRPDRPEAITHA